MRKHLLIVLIILLATGKMFAQSLTVTGKVTDASTNEPMIGVTVEVKGTRAGTATNVDGIFSIEVPSNATLSFISLGYQTKEVQVAGKSVINVTLSENASQLNEVVVVGYGTMRKKDLTGAVTQIIPDRIAAENPRTIQDVLRGTAGLTVTNNPSAKGGGDMLIRGQNSLYTDGGHNNPLIVLDGMIFSGDMSEINPDDVGQIDMLKDASSAAIYGAQAANGVILITTKKGKVGKPVVNINVNVGTTQKSDYRQVWTPDQYLQHRIDYNTAATFDMNPTTGVYEAYQMKDSKGNLVRPAGFYSNPDNLGLYGIDINTWRGYDAFAAGGDSDAAVLAKRNGLDLDNSHLVLNRFLAGQTFDWYNHTFRTGFNQDYNASVSGASDRINYYMSYGFTKNEGAIVGDVFQNIRSNMKVSGKVFDWLEIGSIVNFQRRSDGDNNMMPNLNPTNANINVNQIRNSPYGQYRDENGNLTQYPNGMGNFKGANFDFTNQYQQIDKAYYVLNPQFNAKITFPFNITYTFNAQPRLQWFHNYFWQSSQNPAWTAGGGHVYRENRWWFDWLLNNQIAWEKTFAKVHRVSLTLVQEAGRQQSWRDYVNANNFPISDVLGFHNTLNATIGASNFNTEDTQQSSASYLGKLFYSYNDRYMLTASLRRDGYSAFGTSNPYATFPSLAGSWVFTNEPFFKFEPMNYGKLRVSWGKNGNRGLGDPYVSLSNLQPGGGSTYTYGYIPYPGGGTPIDFQYLQISRMANPNLKWEVQNQWNFGLDFGFLNHRLLGSFDYYAKSTHNMIINQALVAFAGFANMTTNLGQVNNTGIDISLTSVNVKTPVVEWNTSVSFSYNKSKIVHLYYTYDDVLDADGNVIGKTEKNDIANGWFIGQPIEEIWAFKQTGIWQASDYQQAKTDYNQRPGDPIFWKDPNNPLQKAANGYYNYDNKDKVFLGTRRPPINWSMRNEVTFLKNFTLTFNMYSSWGGKRSSNEYLNNDNESNALTQGANAFVHSYWTPENPSTKWARLQAQLPGGITAGDAPKIFDASFIRFDNLSLTYSLPHRWISKLYIQNLKIIGSVRNLGVWCKDWPYGDPETLGGGSNTSNYNSYTDNGNGLQGLATRTYTIGVNITF